MKTSILYVLALLCLGCSSTRFVDSWRNRDARFEPNKLLVVGMTENTTARRLFEEKLAYAFDRRGVTSYEGSEVIDDGFSDRQRTMEEIRGMTQHLISNGFDAVVITAVKGVDDRTEYRPGYYDVSYRWYRFGRYWYAYQDVFHTPGYYTKYFVYHVETAIYNLLADETRSLVWVGSFNVVDPEGIATAVDEYVSEIMKQLEKESLVMPLDTP